MKVEHLRVNHRIRPVIDDVPEFSCYITSEDHNIFSIAYQITVSSDDDTIWDSGKVESGQLSFIKYEGRPLKSRTVYEYTITVWDDHGKTASASDWFETGLYTDDWCGKWAESTFKRNEHYMLSDGIENPVLDFNRCFEIIKEVKKARLYATCYGVYRPLLNGSRIDDREFAPEFTAYSKVLYYQTYDVTGLLKNGINQLDFMVGDGWYFNQQTAPVNTDHKFPSILFQLELEYADGEQTMIVSNENVRCRQTNIIYSDLYVGEKIDLTKEYGDWQGISIADYGYQQLCAQKMEPVRPVETFKPVSIFRSPADELIVDFGQVIAGRCRIHLHENYGTEVVLQHTEVLDKEGNYFAALSSRQREIIICDGSDFVYEPMFTFHGFRYVRIIGLSNIDADDISAVLLSTEKENRGDFYCNDERLNRLYRNIRYSQKNNMMSIPTDCPQREKAGWTGDVLIYGKTSLLNEELTPFYYSWLNGLVHDQYDNGAVPIISPYTKMYEYTVNKTMQDFDDSKPTGILAEMLPGKNARTDLRNFRSGVAGWSDVILWLPYAMYEVNGDTDILEKCYDAMKKWTDNIIITAASKRNMSVDDPEDDRYLWNTGFHFGEWLVPGHVQEGFEITRETSWYVAPMIGYRSVRMMGEIAAILCKEEAEYYLEYAEKMKKAIQRQVLNVHNQYDEYMGRYVLALAFGLCEDKQKKEYEDSLAKLVEKNDGCLGTGFIATPFILDVLDEMGRNDLSLKILFSEKMPSWLYEVKNGATTIWESWNAIEEDGTPNRVSYDHYAYGVIDTYISEKICGLQQASAGFKDIIIRPVEIPGLKCVNRRFRSENGDVEVVINGDILKVKLPCNTKATVYWGKQVYKVGNGEYQWVR